MRWCFNLYLVTLIIGSALCFKFKNESQDIQTLDSRSSQATLQTIRHFTNIGAFVDININQTGVTGTCRLRNPVGQEFTLGASSITGVTVQSDSKFVSCRVTIGPMSNSLLGEWILIQQTTQSQTLQPAIISWANPANPSQARQLVQSAEQNHRTTFGAFITVSLRRESGTSEGCFVVTPDGAKLPISPTMTYPGVSWASRANSITACNIEFGAIDADMIGRWFVVGWFVNEEVRIEARQPVNIILEDGITVLPTQEYLTNNGTTIDISLDLTNTIGTCSLQSPNGDNHALDHLFQLPGVTSHGSSKYVSCRVTIGPMEEDLLGEWILIQHISDSLRREQPVVIDWADPDNPEADAWSTATAIERNVISAVGSIVNISVSREAGFFEGCFITTPDGTTLPVYSRNYPGITFFVSNSVFACIIELGPLDAEMMGRWTLAARFDHGGELTEMRQSMTITHFDGVTTLRRLRHMTNIGAYVDLNLNQTGTSGTCHLRTPQNEEYTLSTSANIAGVTVHGTTNFVSCRVTIGPMTDTLLGEWVIIQQNTDQTRREQPAVIAWANPAEPEKDARQLIIAAEQSITTDLGSIVSVSVDREDGFFEGCYMTLPDGTIVPVFSNTQYPGLTLARFNRFIACLVEIGPVDSNMLGRWTLIAHYNNGGVRIESRQTLNVIEDDGITTLPTLAYLTHIDDTIDINLNQTGVLGTCRLRNPTGQEYTLDTLLNVPGITVQSSGKFVSCRVTIGPMDDSLLGDWILIQQVTGQRERRQPASIQWADPNNPSIVSREIKTAEEQTISSIFGDTISITIPWEDGFFEGCFVTTPDDAHLPISTTTRYPGVAASRSNSNGACNVILGPIGDIMEGRWIIAARFDNDGVLLESQQTLNINRNTDDEIALPLIHHYTNVGAIIDINLNQTGRIPDHCRLLMPDGQIHTLDDRFAVNGVTVHQSSKFVSCRVTIGPMTEGLLGEWTLLEHNTDQTQRRQAVTIEWANDADPVSEPRHFIVNPIQSIALELGSTVNISIRRDEGFFEGCFMTTPDATEIPVFPNSRYPGVTHTGINRLTSCFVDLGPMDAEMVGRWLLAARFNNRGVRVELQQPIDLIIDSGITILPLLDDWTQKGAFVDLTLNQTGIDDTCMLLTPTGEKYTLDSSFSLSGVTIRDRSKFVSCRVSIGPMVQALLGEWTLIAQNGNRQRWQPANIAWANPLEPTAEAREIREEAEQNAAARFGTTVTVSIRREEGLFEGCFITTPDETTLPIFPTIAYPGIKHVGFNRITSCIIELGPVDPDIVGTWILAARFRQDGARFELRQQLNIAGRLSSAMAVIIAVCVICSVLFVLTITVFSFKKSREWSAQKFTRFRNSVRSTASRNNIVEHEL